jgi:hypothetical protein
MEITKILLDTENDIGTEDVMFRIADDATRKQVVFEHDGQHFLYSYVKGKFGGEMIDETYVFSCGETGKSTEWKELFSVEEYMSVEDVMEEMEIEDTMSKER